MSEPVQNGALRWRSRRGLLELELLLMAFVRTRLGELDEEAKACYARLLEVDDCDLYDWLQARDEPDDPTLKAMVEQVRAANVR